VPVCPNCGELNSDRARFCQACAAPLAAQPSPEVRKTVTVLFSDLAGSTALGERLDPEAFREVTSRYFAEMRRVIERHGGTVEKYIGDAIMAVFGLQALHEDDALRACRAAWEMRETLVRLNAELSERWGVTLSNRTGVNTGEVVAGDPALGQRLVTGDAVNVAARLEQAAPPNDVLLGPATYDLARAWVQVERVEPLELKGKSERVPAFLLVDVPTTTASHQREAPFVGRDEELLMLGRGLDRAMETTACQMVTVVGEPGVGKSRLVREFLAAIDGRALVVRGRCLSYGEGITFWPLAEAIREAIGLAEDDSDQRARELLMTSMGASAQSEQVTERLLSVIGRTATPFPVQEVFWAARVLFQALATSHPVVVAFEDVHWAEPTFLDLLDHLRDFVTGAPLLILCSARPEFLEAHEGWSERGANSTLVRVESLAVGESERLLDELFGGADVLIEIRRRLLEASGGNPLFLEQLVAMLLEGGHLEREAGGWRSRTELGDLPIPPSIAALLSVRLEQLGRDERGVMERASVVGQVFYQGAVVHLSPETERPAVPSCLSGLSAKQLIVSAASDFADEDAFAFRHILIRDAAYGRLLKRTRAELHERFAEWLARAAGPHLTEVEEIVGYHLEQATRYRSELGPLDQDGVALAARAADRLAGPGRRALARSDIPAATGLLSRAAALLARGDPARLALLPDLAVALRDGGRFDEAAGLVAEGIDLARDAGEDGIEGQLAVERQNLRISTDPDIDFRAAEREAKEAVDLFTRLGDDLALSRAYIAIAEILSTLGRFSEEDDVLELAAVHARRAGAVREEAEALRRIASNHLWGVTPADQAIVRCEEIASRPGVPQMVLGGAKRALAVLYGMQGRFEEARRAVEEARSVFEALGMRVWVAAGIEGEAAALVEQLAGDPAAEEWHLRRAVDDLQAMGAQAVLSNAAGNLGRVLCRRGRFDEARRWGAVVRGAASSDDKEAQALWRQVEAQVLASQGQLDEAVAVAREAVDLLASTEAVRTLAEAWWDLARVLREADRAEEARGALERAAELYARKGDLVHVARVGEEIDLMSEDSIPAKEVT
jgi:class 3 adenylate cyclase/tetratricopeptide (TPR) repeat protein